MEHLSEQEIFRRNSRHQLQQMGIDPYPAALYPTNAFSVDIRADFDDNLEPKRQVCVAGRIMSRRIMGKASFVELQDSKGRIQIYIAGEDINTAEQPEMYNTVFKKLLDIGDFIGIKGFVFRTRMGEISVHAQELTVLSKSIRPLPIVKYKDNEAFEIQFIGNTQIKRYIQSVVMGYKGTGSCTTRYWLQYGGLDLDIIL